MTGRNDVPQFTGPDAWLACSDPERPLDSHVIWHGVPICDDCRARARIERDRTDVPVMRDWFDDVIHPRVPRDRGAASYRPLR